LKRRDKERRLKTKGAIRRRKRRLEAKRIKRRDKDRKNVI